MAALYNISLPTDITPPTVSIIAPAAGATVGGTITVSASAADNVGIVGVQFKVDGVNLGAELTAAPYSIFWNSALAAQGVHTLTAVARDAAGNSATAPAVSLTVVRRPTITSFTPTSGPVGTMVTISGTDFTGATAVTLNGVSGDPFTVTSATVIQDTVPMGATTGPLSVTTPGGTATSASVFTVVNDTTPPAVSITSPLASATVAGTLTLSASATDNVGVAGVQFNLDGVNLGAEVTAAPYAISWNTTLAANGSHTLTAVARDTAGNTATTAAVSVTVVRAPTITSFTPTSGPVGTIVTISGTDFTGATAVMFNGVSADPFTVTSDTAIQDTVPAGATTGLLSVTTLGGTATSSSVFTVVNPPVITSAGTATGQVGVAFSYQMTATNSPTSFGATVLPAGLALNATTGLISGTPTSAGASTVTLSATNAGGTGTQTLAVTITPATPTASITAPSNNAIVSGTAVAISATASESGGAIAGVQFKLDGANLGVEQTAAPYSISWNTAVAAIGVHTLTAVARDAAGNTATSPAVNVTVNNIPPTVSITAPANGATVAGTVTVSATASDNVGVVGVQFKLDGANLGAEVTTAPYSTAWDTSTAANGSHSLTAVARDAAGNTATATAVTVTVSNASIPPGLVAAYSFNQGSGATALDASGNGNNGTISGATWTSQGRYGSALSFDGVTALVRASNVTLGGAFTIMAWVYNPTNTAYETIVTVGTNRDLYLRSGVITFYDGSTERPFGSAISRKRWHHVAVVSDGSTLSVYLDGAPSGTPQAASFGAITGTLQVGAWTLGSVNYDFFGGRIDEVRVYSRALTQAEVQSDMTTPVAP